jgi:hypothetical protein
MDILEKVMETETYKVAKEILEKFGTEPPASRSATMVSPFRDFFFFWGQPQVPLYRITEGLSL